MGGKESEVRMSRVPGEEASCRRGSGHRVSSLALVAAVLPACFSSRREEREGERQGCAWLRCPRSPLRAPSLPDRKPAPIPSQLQLCHHRPRSTPGPRSHTRSGAQRLHPGSSAMAPKRPGLSRGRLQLTGPSSWSLGLAPHSPTLAPRGVAYAGLDRGPVSQAH